MWECATGCAFGSSSFALRTHAAAAIIGRHIGEVMVDKVLVLVLVLVLAPPIGSRICTLRTRVCV